MSWLTLKKGKQKKKKLQKPKLAVSKRKVLRGTLWLAYAMVLLS
jgi:hypothetical protein